MIGAIIGDIVGSRFEKNHNKEKDFELFTEECRVTDDSIMTIAVAKAIMEAENIMKPTISELHFNHDYYEVVEKMTVQYLQEIGRKYPNCGFGGMFYQWIFSDDPEPYHSFGNGAAMRISPAGYAARTENEACRLSEAITVVTHNHEEGMKGAEATAVAIYMARRCFTKAEIRETIEENYYSLNFTIDEIRDSYQYYVTCQQTVPQAIVAFLESTSFEDAIRNGISLGGDSDTLAAITGSIAEAYYGVPEKLKTKALSYLDDELLSIVHDWFEFIGETESVSKFHVLTKYIGKMSELESFGDSFIVHENDGSQDHPIQFPYVNFNELVNMFVDEFYQFVENNPEYELTNYASILERNGIDWDDYSMRNAHTEVLDEKGILALMMGAIRAERFCDGALLAFFEDGYMLQWLKRLYELDRRHFDKAIEEIYFEIGGFGGYDTYRMTFCEDGAQLVHTPFNREPKEKNFTKEEANHLHEAFKNVQVQYWHSEYMNPCVLDGTQWQLFVKYKGQRGTVWSGSNAYPSNWKDLLLFFGIEEELDE